MLYAITILLSAFLLFQVQPIIAKMILPWFGGSAAVWTTCMLFFQLLLVGGYAYSHWSIRALKPRTQTLVHLALLVAGIAALPILPDASWKPHGEADPSLRILGLLAASVGLPYFLLATTSPLVQAWYARAEHGAMPYRLYALSNLGSMLALVSYPFVVEPWLPTRVQALGWSGGFVAFAIACAALAWRSRTAPAEIAAVADGDAPGRRGSGRLRAVGRARRRGVDPAARLHQPPVAERRADSVPLGAAARALSPLVHPLLRGAQLVPPQALPAAPRRRASSACASRSTATITTRSCG